MVFLITRQFCSPSCNYFYKIFLRSCTSALYVTGDKASEIYSVLTPHLDFDKRFEDIDNLKKNVELRGMDINVVSLKRSWDFMKEVEANKIALEKRRVEVTNKMKLLKSASRSVGDVDVKQKEEQIRIEGKMIRDDLKAVVKGLWGLEGKTVIGALSLPNYLHDDTPIKEPKLIHKFKAKPDTCSDSHLKKGSDLNLIKYSNQLNYYFLNEAAYFELAALEYFGKKLARGGFLQLSNADFARSVVIEGVGVKHKDPWGSIILKNETADVNHDDRLHLIGGASLPSFASFHTKQVVNHDCLPLKYFTLGRQYHPKPLTEEASLHHAWQSSAVEVFTSTSNDFNDMMKEFHDLVKNLISAYESLDIHFQVVYLQANKLQPWESLRASIQLFSSHSQSYVEVGHVALCDDYISKRLLMTYQESGMVEQKFMNVVSGTAVSIPKLLTCLLEQNEEYRLFIPAVIENCMLNGNV